VPHQLCQFTSNPEYLVPCTSPKNFPMQNLSSRPELPGLFLRAVSCAPGRAVKGPWLAPDLNTDR